MKANAKEWAEAMIYDLMHFEFSRF